MAKRDKRSTLFVPDWRSGNPYLSLLADGIERAGWRVHLADYPRGMLKLTRLAYRFPDVGVFHLHWIGDFLEDLLWANGSWKFRVKLALLTLDFRLCRLLGVRIVWTVHNLVEHDTPHPEREKTARKHLFRYVDGLIAHSPEALAAVEAAYGGDDSRAVTAVIPHGNYIGSYPEDPRITTKLRERLELREDDFVLLFFGAIRLYKGVDVLLRAFSALHGKHFRLLVVGRHGNGALARRLQEQAACDPRIRTDLRFVPDDEVASYFALASAVILPFERTLTSGSVLLAMSQGKALILPEDARVLGVPGNEGARYYRGEAALADVLQDLDDSDLQRMGTFNRACAERLDWSNIGIDTVAVYTGTPAPAVEPASRVAR